MPAALTGAAAVDARDRAPRRPSAPADPLAPVASALLALANELRAAQAKEPRDDAALQQAIVTALAAGSRETTRALAGVSSAVLQHDGALQKIVAAVHSSLEKPQSFTMTVTERDADGRIKSVKFEANR